MVYSALLLRSSSRTLLVTLEWIEFGCVHKIEPVDSDCVASVGILDNGLFYTVYYFIQYDRLSLSAIGLCLCRHYHVRMRSGVNSNLFWGRTMKRSRMRRSAGGVRSEAGAHTITITAGG